MAAVPSSGPAAAPFPAPPSPAAAAARDLYERYHGQIFGFCVNRLRNREEAEDATQATFLNAFRALDRGVSPEAEAAWLFAIAGNVCRVRRRSAWRRGRVESPADLAAVEELVPARTPEADELIGLPEALERLPETQRRALLLREWQGLSYRELADELGLSQSAVETLLFRARRSLARGLAEEPSRGRPALSRLRASGEVGSIAAVVKTLLFGGGAKVAITAATVAATSVVAATPTLRHDFVAAVEGPRAVVAPAEHAARRPVRKPAVVRKAAPVRVHVAPQWAAAVAPPAPAPAPARRTVVHRHAKSVAKAAPIALAAHRGDATAGARTEWAAPVVARAPRPAPHAERHVVAAPPAEKAKHERAAHDSAPAAPREPPARDHGKRAHEVKTTSKPEAPSRGPVKYDRVVAAAPATTDATPEKARTKPEHGRKPEEHREHGRKASTDSVPAPAATDPATTIAAEVPPPAIPAPEKKSGGPRDHDRPTPPEPTPAATTPAEPATTPQESATPPEHGRKHEKSPAADQTDPASAVDLGTPPT